MEKWQRDIAKSLDHSEEGFPPARPLDGVWRYNIKGGFLCCGTLRIAATDIDPNPNKEFEIEVFNWICEKLNSR